MELVDKKIEVHDWCVLEVVIYQNIILVIEMCSSSHPVNVLWRSIFMNIGKRLIFIMFVFYPFEYFQCSLELIGFSYSFCSNNKTDILACDMSVDGGRVEKSYDKLVELWVLMGFDLDWFGCVWFGIFECDCSLVVGKVLSF